MDLADFIKFGAAEPVLRSLVGGGYAVAAHGHTRPTFDVDLMIRRQDAPEWHRRARAAGLSTVGESKAFIQYSQPQGGDGLDLMLVSDETFEQMWSASEEKELGYGRARVPCLDHLLALKLHALKQGLSHRTSKDAEDVEILVRRNRVDLKDARYELLFNKSAAERSMNPSFESLEIRESGRTPPSLDVNLPDGPSFRMLPPLVSISEMIDRIQLLRSTFPHGLKTPEERWRDKSGVEFAL